MAGEMTNLPNGTQMLLFKATMVFVSVLSRYLKPGPFHNLSPNFTWPWALNISSSNITI